MSDSIQYLANTSMRIGHVVKRWTDVQGRECRARVDAIVECPVCHKNVALTSETEEWVKHKSQWMHNSYDFCPSGECCGQAIIFNGLEGKVLVLEVDDGD